MDQTFQGFVPARNEMKASCGVPESTVDAKTEQSEGLAERVGFVPGDPAPVNNLGQFSIAQIARNAQNLSIRYKTGTAQLSSVAAGAGLLNRYVP